MEQRKKDILGFFKDLKFNEKNHLYYVNNVRLKLSVSGLIKRFVEPFDTQGISKRVAHNNGVSQKSILKEWETKRIKGCQRGKEAHLFGELYTFNRHLEPKTPYEEAIVQFWDDLPPFIVPVLVELKMYHKEYFFGGTKDILLYNTDKDTYIPGDYKTNENLFKNYRGKKMLDPFDFLLDNGYNKAQLQLSLYQILFEQLGLKISARKLIWLRPTGEYEMYDTEDYTEILSDYLKNNKL